MGRLTAETVPHATSLCLTVRNPCTVCNTLLYYSTERTGILFILLSTVIRRLLSNQVLTVPYTYLLAAGTYRYGTGSGDLIRPLLYDHLSTVNSLATFSK